MCISSSIYNFKIYSFSVKKKETPVPKGYKEHYAFEDSSDDDSQDPRKVKNICFLCKVCLKFSFFALCNIDTSFN